MQESQIIRNKSKISYSYATVKLTQSRIDKGLIAIPVSLAEWFPDHNCIIQVYLNDLSVLQTKNYSSYNSTTRECRIGSMREWFEENDIKNGDEIVIQLIDKTNAVYRLTSERKFIAKAQALQNNFDNSDNEQRASEEIVKLAQWTNLDKEKTVSNEYYRLVNAMPIIKRDYIEKHSSRVRESIPVSLRTLLENIYKGYCQVCDFWFLKQDNQPYFETHHLNPLQGHHPKNIIVVCGNCHNQFEYANVQHEFNNDGWLTSVSFNGKLFLVHNLVLDTKPEESYKELFI